MLLSISLNHDSPGLADGGGDLAATRGSTVRPAWRRAPVGQAGPLSGGPKRVRRAGASGRRPGRGRRAAVEATHIGVTLTQECVTDVATEPPWVVVTPCRFPPRHRTRARARKAQLQKRFLTPFFPRILTVPSICGSPRFARTMPLSETHHQRCRRRCSLATLSGKIGVTQTWSNAKNRHQRLRREEMTAERVYDAFVQLEHACQKVADV
jgi:hypothetical protein